MVCACEWSEMRYSLCATKTLATTKLAFFFFVLQNRNLILARPGALRRNHVTYASRFKLITRAKKKMIIN